MSVTLQVQSILIVPPGSPSSTKYAVTVNVNGGVDPTVVMEPILLKVTVDSGSATKSLVMSKAAFKGYLKAVLEALDTQELSF